MWEITRFLSRDNLPKGIKDEKKARAGSWWEYLTGLEIDF